MSPTAATYAWWISISEAPAANASFAARCPRAPRSFAAARHSTS